MTGYIVKRTGGIVVSLWGGVTIVFFVVRLTGNPALVMLPPGATLGQIHALSKALGFDRPLLVQYGRFVSGLLTGNWGKSLVQHQSALTVVLQRVPATAELAGAAMLIAVVVGMPLGVLAGTRRASGTDFLIRASATTVQSLPVFWLGIMLILVFSVVWHVFPAEGRSGLLSLVLPAVTLSAYPMATIARLTRSSLLDVLQEEYIATAEIKGLSRARIVLKHALHNALPPVLTVFGLQVGTLLGGAVVTETVFAWPGVGQLTILSIQERDFPVVQVIVILAILMVSVTNLFVDIACASLDPRVSQGLTNAR